MGNRFVSVVVLVALVAGNVALVSAPAQAAGSVVINEIYYNPPDDLDGDAEFIELHNPGDAPFDLSGASFTGFDLVMPDGISLAPGEYAIVSPSIAIAEATWGVTPIAQFAAGGISGGGEQIALTDAGGNVLDDVSYLDTAPWPGGPDGNGPSLELINPSLDNSLAESWAASIGGPTPAAQNSVFTTGEVPAIGDVILNPATPGPADAVTISATVAGGTASPTLTYVVGFNGSENVLAMTNPGGNTWQATIPSQSASELVRYRIDAGTAALPTLGDTINYLGYVVEDPSVVTNLPVFQWFVDPGEYQNMVDNLFLTDEGVTSVVAYNGVVVDNAFIHVRGGSYSRNAPKKNFKVELPDGYLLDMGGPYPVDEFAMQAEWVDWTFTNALVAWEVWNADSLTTLGSNNVRIQQNGDFYGLYRYQQTYDGTWREMSGYDNGQLFKAEGGWDRNPGFDKKNPKDGDFSSVENARSVLEQGPSGSKTAWIYDNVNVPAMVNFLALTALTRHQDQAVHNFYVYFDDETGRVWHLPWDLDQTWRPFGGRCGDDELRTAECIEDLLMDSVWEIPEVQDMYWRRLQTLVDTYLPAFDLEDRRVEMINNIGVDDATLEVNRWGRSNIVTSNGQAAKWNDNIAARRSLFANEPRLPGSQSANLSVVINELQYNPLDTQPEFLELFNPTAEAIDLSGWEIDGVGLTIQPGTVILPGSYLVFTDNDPLLQALYVHDISVGGMYPGGLKGSGETITLSDRAGNVVDVVDYLDEDPWPTEPDGTGVSLSLVDPALDNNVASNWVASASQGGTPGLANDADPGTALNGPVTVFASGDQGDERMEVIINGNVEETFIVAGPRANVQAYDVAFNGPVSSLRVAFTNNGGSGSTDRNLRVDRVVVGGANFETEDPSVFGSDTFDGTGYCRPGYNQTEILYCNGYFEYDLTGGSPVDDEAPVFAGATLTVGAVTSTTAALSWTAASDNVGVVGYRVYVNDALVASPTGTSFVLSGLTPDSTIAVNIEAVDAAGNQSTDGPTGPVTTDVGTGGASVVVHASGDQGEENMDVIINGSVAASFIVTAPRNVSVPYAVPFEGTVSSLRVAFTNNGGSGSSDRNLRVDKVVIDGVTYETEDPSVFGTEIYNGSNYCVEGFSQTEILYCNGYFEYDLGDQPTDEIPPTFDNPNLVATPSSSSIELSWTEATDAVGVAGYRLFVNGSAAAETAGLTTTVGGLTPDTPYDIVVQAFDAAGNVSTDGPSVTVSTLPGTGGTLIQVFASGETGDENADLYVNGQLVQSWTAIGTVPVVLSHEAAAAPSEVEVHFTNDLYDPGNGIDRTLIVDRIEVAGEVFESEAPNVYSDGSWTSSDGCDPGFKLSENLNCNGFFRYDVSDDPTGTAVTVSAPMFDDKKLDFDLTNIGGQELVIVSAALSWPENVNKELKKIKNDGKEIFDDQSSPPLSIGEDDWKGSTGDRRLQVGETDTIRFEFEDDASTDLAQYSLTLTFSDGSTLDLAP